MVDITTEFEAKLKSYIEEVESKSPIEIVPVVIKKSASYTQSSIIWGMVLSYIPVLLYSHYIPFWGSMTLSLDCFLWLSLSFLIAFILRRAPFFNKLLPRSLMHKRCMQMAESLFLSEGVFETHQRLGILITVFEFEKTVLVLADKGFNEHIAKDYWPKLGATLAKDFNRAKVGDEFFEALKEIQRDIAPHFKITGENPNELSDELRKK